MTVCTRHGVFTMEQASDIAKEYEICSTLEYLMENYSNAENQLRLVAELARELMEDFGFNEDDAIDSACEKMSIELTERS